VSSQPKQTEKGKNRKKKVLTMSIFKPSSLYIHTTHEKREIKRLRDAIEESLCIIFFIIFRI